MGAKGKQCWEAVKIGTGQSRIYPTLAFQSAKSAERHCLLVPATLCDGNPPNVQKIWPDRTETLRSSHWSNCKFCDLDGSKLLYQLTLDCGKVRQVRVPSGLSQRLCCNKRAVRICVAGCFNWREGDPALVSVTLHSHITLSPGTCHPIQCRANMRVADCATVWVCKCLQLIYLSALHLTLFDIYRIYGKI